MLNWFVWNRTVFLDLNCALMLNWIVWNRTIYMYRNGFGIKWPTMVDMPENQTKPNQNDIWPSRLGLQNASTASLLRGKSPQTSFLDMYSIWTVWWRSSSNAGALKNVEYPFNAIAPRSTLTRRGSIWEGLIYGSNRTKLYTCAKLNCLK